MYLFVIKRKGIVFYYKRFTSAWCLKVETQDTETPTCRILNVKQPNLVFDLFRLIKPLRGLTLGSHRTAWKRLEDWL